MFSSFFETRPRRVRHRTNRSPLTSSYAQTTTSPQYSRTRNSNTLNKHQNQESSQDDTTTSGSEGDEEEGSEEEETEETEDEQKSALLPMFDASKLDTIPTYVLTHTLRLLVESRCDTVLSWDQLLSPQVTQFLIKPVQQEILTNHFCPATIYCLMANCLQFTKEVNQYPANSGTIQTRAMVSELLALKLLKEHTTRGLIDALSYDFDPMHGHVDVEPPVPDHRPSWQSGVRRQPPRPARVSCLEIAIRAQAKRFLAHPVVIQQLEAIWNGSIVFHAATDSVCRKLEPFARHYGTTSRSGAVQRSTQRNISIYASSRKVVTLYKPRDASLLKLSRLRVPRYRNILSTISLAILLGLFTGVLVKRSIPITALDIVFWIWAAGFLMDGFVGFSEHGFSLYVVSFWNNMDLGILLLLVVHLCLRMYGLFISDDQKHHMAGLAHDILAADAILLFPRLFSVLDHNRYFSQLIIAFRLMGTDLVGVSILMAIACSGFFVALTLSFGNQSDDGASVAYLLLQMVMGFTPAVWDRWASYTPLGRTILVLFLWLCHFLILTILVAVLTNSFMTVVKNANEEHQFIFAVNTISSVKSDHLFSFIAPLNVIQWTLSPLRFILPFKQFVKLNRVVIKITHFPILFGIYAYEKTILQSTVVDSIDVVDIRKGARSIIAQHLPKLGAPSVANFRQDQALEEVFKQPFGATVRTDVPGTRNSNTVVNRWMRDIAEDVIRSPQNDSNKISRLDKERLDERRHSTISKTQRSSRKALSLTSDPANLISDAGFFSTNSRIINTTSATPSHADQAAHEDTGDGDDEMPTNDIEDDRMTIDSRGISIARPLPSLDYFSHRHSPITRTPVRAASIRSSSSDSRASRGSHGSRSRHHNSVSGYASPIGLAIRNRPSTNLRNISSATMIYNPPTAREFETNIEEHIHHPTASHTRPMTPGSKPSSGNSKKTPKSKQASRLREMFPNKDGPSFRSAPDLKSLTHPVPIPDARRASLEMDLVSDLGDNKAIGGGYVGAIPTSFAKQMTSGLSQLQRENKEEQQMLGRLMMARMNTLEEGFREVIHEMRENLKVGSRNRSPERPVQERRERRAAAARHESRSLEKFSSSLRENDSSGSTLFTDPKQSKLPISNINMNRPHMQSPIGAEKRREEKRDD